MKDFTDTLSKIEANTSLFKKNSLDNILVLFDEEIKLLGDCCVIFDKFRHLKTFFNAQYVDLNFTQWKNRRFVESLLFNNSYVNKIAYDNWEDINFEKYQMIIFVSYEEEKLIHFLHDKYRDQIKYGSWEIAITSVSTIILKPLENESYVFPVNRALNDFVNLRRRTELYLTEREERWANEWLRAKGVEKAEELIIMVDSSAVKSKLLKVETYFEILKGILKRGKTKVLIFDERNTGKEDFYRDWLGKQALEKIIFSKSLTLRQDLSLLGAAQVKMIFGPCSGLMHCASSIYNNYVIRGKKHQNDLRIIVYTGWYGNVSYNLNLWWGESPLVDCLVLKEYGDDRKIFTLIELPVEERDIVNRLPCSAYTKDILLDYLNNKLNFYTS
ncbi:hypothetical protein AY601_2848 [Pedobacter cryoconitis]|uniref:ADP-heptose:LPS heptosyltransferase n=1 Tax=Pedobacter cryoconitis TaxID=188932 RepID=A0A127VEE7_9SPHI|nr:hypothetical protein [Pedobacter cryoconitis]AMP99726.1 hypothetical protein AY601_2848 [Pedobacter cryoconitis]